MASKGLGGSRFAGSRRLAKPHAHRKGKRLCRGESAKKRKERLKRKMADPRSWGLVPAPGGPTTLLATCTKPTRDPMRGPKPRDDDEFDLD